MSLPTRRVGRRAPVLLETLLVATVAWLAPADAQPAGTVASRAAQEPPRPIYDGAMWRVDLTSVATRAETGSPAGFDRADYASVVYGSSVGVVGKAREDSYLLRSPPPGRPAAKDGPTAYSVAFSSSTEVRVTCKPGSASFTADGSGKGNLSISFHDGTVVPPDVLPLPSWLAIPQTANASLLFVSAGTGFSKAALGLKAEGDLAYDPTGQAAGLAESVGDDASSLQGSVSLPGLEGGPGLSYTPHVGAGTITKAIARTKTVTAEKQAFEFALESHVTSDVKADDSLVGAANASVAASVTHTATVRGDRCRDATKGDNGWTSNMSLTVIVRGSETSALLTILTTDAVTGQAFEIVQEWHGPFAAVFHRTDRGRLVSTGWDLAQHWGVDRRLSGSGPPARREAVPVARAGRRLGVEEGSVAEYAVVARRPPLSLLETLKFEVADADAKTGRVVLDGSATFRDGRVDRTAMPVDVFTGQGGVRMILVPAGLEVGERLYGVGRVVRVQGDRTTIDYRKGRGRITAVYDRDTGWLAELVGGDPRRPEFTLTRR